MPGARSRAMRTCPARLAMALSACHRCAAGRRPRTPRQNGFVPMATTTHRTAHHLCPPLATGRRRAERPIGFVPMASRPRLGAARGDLGVVAGRAPGWSAPAPTKSLEARAEEWRQAIRFGVLDLSRVQPPPCPGEPRALVARHELIPGGSRPAWGARCRRCPYPAVENVPSWIVWLAFSATASTSNL
jgi:hypothetical protein